MDDEDDSNEVDGEAQEYRSNRYSWICRNSLPILQTRDGDFLWNCVLIKGGNDSSAESLPDHFALTAP
jgi:hypothetical protein